MSADAPMTAPTVPEMKEAPAPTEKGDGVVVVPREPTEAMIEAAHRATPATLLLDGDAHNIWSAMIAATQRATGEGFRKAVAAAIERANNMDVAVDNVMAVIATQQAVSPPEGVGEKRLVGLQIEARPLHETYAVMVEITPDGADAIRAFLAASSPQPGSDDGGSSNEVGS